MALYGGIEAGGTKFVCAIGSGPDEVWAEIQFPTTTPEETISRAVQFFRRYQTEAAVESIGVASFGPVDPEPDSPTYGYITATPKPGWKDTNIIGPIQQTLGVDVYFDTDVNGAALAEYRWGIAQDLDTFVYLTVGTGLGGGGMVNGRLIHGLMHPEMGHMRIAHDWERDPYAGFCSFHGDCLEGLACGPAIEDRWKFRADELPAGHPSWHLEAHYLAQGLVNIICILSPQRIIMGGGVMKQTQLFPLIRGEVQTLFNAYLVRPEVLEQIEDYIVPPALGDRAGVLGAIALAQRKTATAHDIV